MSVTTTFPEPAERATTGAGPVVGVKTTRIYCRPICRPGRMPRRENCLPFPDAAAARAAGYRACKLCRPDDPVAPERLSRVGAPAETVRFGTGPTPLGTAFAAITDRGLCALFFGDGDVGGPARERLASMFPGGRLVEDEAAVAEVIRRLSDWLDGGPEPDELALDLRGTAFQVSVWDALRAIPSGSTCTYGELARRIGRASAVRAVGAACGANPVAVLVPCHRAIGSDGKLVSYRWGIERKRALLEREGAAPPGLFSR